MQHKPEGDSSIVTTVLHRAWSDKDGKQREDDDEVVTRNEFRLLLVYLGIYATCTRPSRRLVDLHLARRVRGGAATSISLAARAT